MFAFKLNFLKKEHISLMLELDQLCYQPEYQSNEEITKFRWERNAKTDLVVLDGNYLVGYISLLPIDQATFCHIKKGNFEESEVEKNVLPWNRNVCYAYLSSIVVNKMQYPHFPGRYLFILLQTYLSMLRKRGIFIRGIIALSVSKGGRKILRKMNFREIKSNIFVYTCNRQEAMFVTVVCSRIPPGKYSLEQLKVKDVDV